MRLAILLMVALITPIISTVPAQAQFFYQRGSKNNSSKVNATQAQLKAHINQGIADGRLTQREASRLQKKMNRLNQLEARMRNSGSGLGFKERNRLMSQLSKLNDEVVRNLHDYERRKVGYRNHRNWR